MVTFIIFSLIFHLYSIFWSLENSMYQLLYKKTQGEEDERGDERRHRANTFLFAENVKWNVCNHLSSALTPIDSAWVV